MQNETCAILPMQNTYPPKWLRCKLVLTLEQVSNYCRQHSPLDSNKEHQAVALAWFKPGANSVRLDRRFHCSVPQSLQMQKEYIAFAFVKHKKCQCFQRSIFCTSAEFIFTLFSLLDGRDFLKSYFLQQILISTYCVLVEGRHRSELGVFPSLRAQNSTICDMYNALIYVA